MTIQKTQFTQSEAAELERQGYEMLPVSLIGQPEPFYVIAQEPSTPNLSPALPPSKDDWLNFRFNRQL